MHDQTIADRAKRDAFRRRIEILLRQGEADAALAEVRNSLRRLDGADEALVSCALSTEPEQIWLTGWADLGQRVAQIEARGEAVTAVGIDFSWPGHFAAAIESGMPRLDYDSEGGFSPRLETNYYGDTSGTKFSTATRSQINESHFGSGSEWQGCFIDMDNLIGVHGLDALYGAVQKASVSHKSDDVHRDAYELAAMASAVLLHLAVRRTIEREGLPRKMAVLVGSNEDFPFFDAPVMPVDEAEAHVAIFDSLRSEELGERQRAKAGNERLRAEQEAESRRFDPIEGLKHFGEAAKTAGELVEHIKREKEVFLGIGVIGLAFLAHQVRSRK